MLRRLMFASSLLVASCEPAETPAKVPADSSADATTTIIADDAERRRLIVEAEGGDGASAYILSLDLPGDEGRRWLERAVQLDWPEARRDKAVRMLGEEPCRLAEARALLAGYRAARETPEEETVYLDRLVTSAEAAQGACRAA